MAVLPFPNKCPIKNKPDGVCMCVPPRKCEEVIGSETCFGIRSAYAYGCNVTETKYTNAMTEKIALLNKTLISLSDDGE